MSEMVIDGQAYVEAKPDYSNAGPHGDVCRQCAFGISGGLKHCVHTVEVAAPAAFGGNCMSRDVIYLAKGAA